MGMWSGCYQECPICGHLHDDGTIYFYKDKRFFLCLDCSEDLTEKEIIGSLKSLYNTGKVSAGSLR